MRRVVSEEMLVLLLLLSLEFELHLHLHVHLLLVRHVRRVVRLTRHHLLMHHLRVHLLLHEQVLHLRGVRVLARVGRVRHTRLTHEDCIVSIQRLLEVDHLVVPRGCGHSAVVRWCWWEGHV